MTRAFVALPIPDAVQGNLRMAQFLLPLPSPVPPKDFHLTLTFLGSVADPVLVAVHEALDRNRPA
jgi:2'-5' RNA ligase